MARARHVLPRRLALSLLVTACTVEPAAGPRRVSPDSILIFEQRRASSESAEPDWEAWQLYESGRFVHERAAAAQTKTRLAPGRLRAVRAWLAQHDFELAQSSKRGAHAGTNVAASCQLHLSTGLVLAPFGDPRYYGCDELKRLCAEPEAQGSE
jgi:hypothetical protein